jgi:two-component system sensor histidine kinase CpxA
MIRGKLYIKIFLSFLVVLIVTEILVFGLFLLFSRKIFHSRLEQYARGEVMIVKAFIDEKIKSAPETSPADNESLKHLLMLLSKAHRARIWLAAPDGATLLKSFPGAVPDGIGRFSKTREKDFGSFKMYTNFRKERVFYIVIPVEIRKGVSGSLHILSEKIEREHNHWIFGIGLAVIGFAVALLIIPVSRLITEPLKRLRLSALRIAEGNLSHRASVKGKDEIGELSRSFNRMADKLERMIRGGRELTANISHELRSPLARIRISEELLREKLEQGNDKDFNRHLEDIREDIGELDSLIDRLLVLSKLDIHETPLKYERLDPPELINGLLERLRPSIDQRNLYVEVDLSFDPPVFGDREALHTALSNILDNAVKFSPDSGNVIVRMSSEGDFLKIDITNSFEALSDEDLTRIFEPFYRAEGSMAAGSGLGLAIAKKIIERHGGNIEARNSDKGLQIRITLPTGPIEGGS